MNAQTPEIIQQNPDSWFWTSAWRRMHCRKQQFNSLFIGQCGKGKSYAALASAELIDRLKDGDTRFNIEKVAFSAHDFAKLTNRKMAVGEVAILDDAALAIYSKDAMTRAVKFVSKIFISQRHLRRCILLSAPSRDMLAKNVLQTLLTSINMLKINERENKSYGRAYWTQLNPLSGKLYFKKFTYKQKAHHEIHGLALTQKYIRSDLTFPLPSKQLVKDYEKQRKEMTKEHYEEAEKATAKKEEKNKRTAADDYNFVKGNIEQFLDNQGKVSVGKLIIAGVSEFKAKNIAKLLNEERGGVCGTKGNTI